MNRLAADPTDRMSRFERAVVFRIARAYFLTCIGGVAVSMRGFFKTTVTAPIMPPPPPQRPKVNYSAVQQELDREAERATNEGSKIGFQDQDVPPTGNTEQAGRDPLEQRFDGLVRGLQSLFPAPTYVWTNQMERTCTAPTSFGCLRWENRIKKAGVVATINSALAGVVKDTPRDVIKATMIANLEVLTRVLSEAPIERRLELIEPILQIEKRSQARQANLELEHKARLAEMERNFKTEVELNEAKHEDWKTQGMYGLATGFVLLIVVSLFLAFLSMERHTRILEKLANVDAQRRESAS
jgi:hypothetical protein